VNAHAVHSGNEVQGVAAVFAFAEAIPDVFGETHPKLRGVLAFVNGTRPAQAVSAPFELVKQAVVLKHLLHGDGRFDGLEVNELCFGHSFTPVFICGEHCGSRS
jgi:hypothetical protein